MEETEASGGAMAPIRRAPFVYAVTAAYAAALCVATMAGSGGFDWWLPALVVLSLASLVAPLPAWLDRWAPLGLVAVLFLALGGFSARQGSLATSTLPIDVDRALTGVVIPVWLQQHLGGVLHAPAGLITGEYMAHYVAPLLTAAWLWWHHRQHFDRFVATYVLAMVVGFTVYLAFPQAPPWYAAQHGLLPPLHRTIVEVLQSIHAGGLYAGADPEPFGAMPSLHVTIPVIVSATLIARMGSAWRWLWVLYPATVAFGVMLMAEHYLVDTAAGAAVGVAAVMVVRALPDRAVSGPVSRAGALARRGRPEPA
jgi:hypothetical protein